MFLRVLVFSLITLAVSGAPNTLHAELQVA